MNNQNVEMQRAILILQLCLSFSECKCSDLNDENRELVNVLSEHSVVKAALSQASKKKDRFPQSMDAQLWAQKWMETIQEHPDIPNDEGTMIGWFANAIMAGYDAAIAQS